MSRLSASEIWPEKPKLRGIPHSVGALLAIPATILGATNASSGVASTSALVYGLSLFFLLSTGALLSLFWPLAPRWLNVGLTVAMGWLILPHALIVAEALGPLSVGLMLVGGVLYSLGGVV